MKYLKYIIPTVILGVMFGFIAYAVSPQSQLSGGTATSTIFSTGQIIYQGSSSYAGATLGSGLSLTGGVLSATGGSLPLGGLQGQFLGNTATNTPAWLTPGYFATVCAAGCNYTATGTADQTGINQAIAAANAAGGGTVLVKQGSYNTTALIRLLSYVNLIGEGNGTKINIGFSGGEGVSASGTVFSSIQNMYFDGSGQSASPYNSDYLIHIVDSHQFTLNNNTAVNCNGFCVKIDSAYASTTNVSVINNYFQGNGRQDVIGGGPLLFVANPVQDVNIVGNILVAKSFAGGVQGMNMDVNCADMVQVNGVKFSDNNCKGNLIFGAEVSPDTNSAITNNILDRPLGPIDVSAQIIVLQNNAIASTTPTNLVISGNIIKNGNILAEGSAANPIQHLLITNNSIQTSTSTFQNQDSVGEFGMLLKNTIYSTISGNDITAYPGTASTTNSCSGSPCAGVASYLSSNNTITNNTIKDFNSGVQLGSSTDKSILNTFINVPTPVTSFPVNIRNILDFNNNILGINTSTQASALFVQPSGGVNPFTIASSSGTSLFTVNGSGSTTISSLASAGCVGSTATGGLYVTGCGAGGSFTATAGVGTYLTSTSTSAATFNTFPLYTYTVAAGTATSTTNFPYIETALNAANANGGAWISLVDPSYTITSTAGLKLPSNTIIQGKGPGGTTINFNGVNVPTLFKASTTSVTNVQIRDLKIVQSQSIATTTSVGIDMSNMAESTFSNIFQLTVGKCYNVNDTNNVTFYDRIQDNYCFDGLYGIYSSSTNPTNMNYVDGFRMAAAAASGPSFASSSAAVYLTKAQNWNLKNVDSEPDAVNTNNYGIRLVPTANGDVEDTIVDNGHLEGNGTGLQINANVQRTQILGGQFSGNSVNNISDSGQWTKFDTVDNNFVTLNQFPNFTMSDNIPGGAETLFKDNTAFAHQGSNLVRMQLQNGTDTSNLLNLQNAGTGYTIVATSTTSSFYLTSTGRVGIGSSTPAALLAVQGSSNQTIPLLNVASSTKSSVFSVLANGNVSISSVATSSTALLMTNPSGQTVLQVDETQSTAGISIGTTSTASTLIIQSGINITPFIISSSSGITLFQIDANGNILSGGTAPTVSSGSITANSTNTKFRLIPAAAATTDTVTFANGGFGTAPFCTVTQETGTAVSVTASATPTTLVISSVSTIGLDSFTGICFK